MHEGQRKKEFKYFEEKVKRVPIMYNLVYLYMKERIFYTLRHSFGMKMSLLPHCAALIKG